MSRVPWNKGLKTCPLSEKTKRILSEQRKGRLPRGLRKYSEEHGCWNKGKRGIYSEEVINKMSASHKGKKRPHSMETRRKISLALQGKNIGRKISEHTKRKMSLAHSGRHLSESTKQKLSIIRKGTTLSAETKAKLSKINIGKYVGSKSPCFGKKHTPLQNLRFSLARRGKYTGKENHFYGKSGALSPVWNDGSSFKPYTLDFNKDFKRMIKMRDDFTCQLCLINVPEIDENKGVLQIHHIDYDKKNSFNENCITLCTKCHGLTKKDRSEWKVYFQNLLIEKHHYINKPVQEALIIAEL